MDNIKEIIPEKVDLKKARWITEKYPGAEEDIERDYIAYFFWKTWDGKEATLDNDMLRARALANAKMQALTQTNFLAGMSERSVLLQLYKANKTRWFQYVDEMSSIYELLEAIYAEEVQNHPNSGKRWEVKTLLEKVVPLLEAMGVSMETIISIPNNLTKARSTVSSINQLLKTDTDDSRNQIVEICKLIADPNITVSGISKIVPGMVREVEFESLPPLCKAEIFLVAPGQEVIVMYSSKETTGAIERITKGVVEGFEIRSGLDLLKKLMGLLQPKKHNIYPYTVKDGELVHSGNGKLMLPDIDVFSKAVMEEITRSFSYIKELLVYQDVFVSAHQVYNTDRDKDWINNLVGLQAEELRQLLITTYPCPDLETLGLTGKTDCRISESALCIGVILECVHNKT